MRYAIVENDKVINVIILSECNFSDFPEAIRLEDRPVEIGDMFVSGRFYRDGIDVLTPVELAQAEADSYESGMAALVDIIFENDLGVIG